MDRRETGALIVAKLQLSPTSKTNLLSESIALCRYYCVPPDAVKAVDTYITTVTTTLNPGETLFDASLPPGVRQFRASTRIPTIQIGVDEARYLPKNLSIGGIFLLSETRPPLGSTLRIALSFSTENYVVDARVTHHQGDGFGLSFIEPSEELSQRLRAVLDEHVAPIERDAYHALKKTMYRELRDRMLVAWTSGNQRYDATLFDLSDTGVFLRSDIVPDNDSEIYVYLPRLQASGSHVVAEGLHAARAQVVFRNSGLIGARFLGASAEFRMTIRALLAK